MFGVDSTGAATWDRRFGRAPARPLGTCEARLTLQSGTPFSTADQSGSTVYLAPLTRGSRIELYDATVSQWIPRTLAAEISVAVPATVFRLFDLFGYWTGAAVALETVNWNQSTGSITAATAANPCVVTSAAHGLAVNDMVGVNGVVGTLGTNANNGLNGKVWTVTNTTTDTFELQGSDTSGLTYTSGGTWYKVPNTRATALTAQDGVYAKSGDASRRYLGTAMTTSTSGNTEDGISKRFLWNAYHRQRKHLYVTEETNSWTYSTAAWRPANNRIANRVELVCGLDEDMVAADVYGLTFNDSAGPVAVAQSVGLKQTGGADAQFRGVYADVGTVKSLGSSYRGFPGLGYSYLQWIEYSEATPTTFFYGDAGTTIVRAGLVAEGMF